MQRTIAKIVSGVFGAPWILVAGWMILFKTGLSPEQTMFMGVLYVVFFVLFPGVYIAYAMKKGLIEDLDITKRQERYMIMTIYLVSHILVLAVSLFYGNARLVEEMLMLSVVFASVYLITFYWKISLHMVVNVLGITLLNINFGWHLAWLYLLIPVVAWSRLVLKKHTPAQLIAGAVLTFVEMMLVKMI